MSLQLQEAQRLATKTQANLEEAASQASKLQKEAADREQGTKKEAEHLKSLVEDRTRLTEELALHKGSYEGSLITIASLQEDLRRADQQGKDATKSSQLALEKTQTELEAMKTAMTQLRKELSTRIEKNMLLETQLSGEFATTFSGSFFIFIFFK